MYDALNSFLASRLEGMDKQKQQTLKETVINSRQNSIVQSSRNNESLVQVKNLIRPKTRDALYNTMGPKVQLKSELN